MAKTTIWARVENADYSKLQEIANQQNCKISDIARTAIQQFLKKDEKDESAEIKEMLNEVEQRLTDRIGKYKTSNKESLQQLNQALNYIYQNLQQGGSSHEQK